MNTIKLYLVETTGAGQDNTLWARKVSNEIKHSSSYYSSKLRCQTRTTHKKNITSNFSQARSTLPDDGSQTIRNMSEWFLIVF